MHNDQPSKKKKKLHNDQIWQDSILNYEWFYLLFLEKLKNKLLALGGKKKSALQNLKFVPVHLSFHLSNQIRFLRSASKSPFAIFQKKKKPTCHKEHQSPSFLSCNSWIMAKMRRRCKSPSSFIKFLTDDNIEEEIVSIFCLILSLSLIPFSCQYFGLMGGKFWSFLQRIPPAFAKEIKEFSKKWVLKTDLLIKKTWIVKLEQQDSHYYLTKLSWPDFVKNHKIKSGDFLIFRYIGVNADDLSTFEVALFSANGLPKAIIDSPRPISSPETSDSHQEPDETLRPSGDSIRRPKRTRQETTCRTSPRLKRQPSKKAKNRGKVFLTFLIFFA